MISCAYINNYLSWNSIIILEDYLFPFIEVMNRPFYGVTTLKGTRKFEEVAEKQNVPGPSSYTTSFGAANNNLPSWSLKSRLKEPASLNKNPPPGFYDLKSGEKIISKNIRSPMWPKKQQLAPYSPQKLINQSELTLPSSINPSKGHSFGYRNTISKRQDTPGPNYDVTKSFNAMNKPKGITVISPPTKKFKDDAMLNDTPCPNTYFPKDKEPLGKNAESWSFPKSVIEDNTGQGLGPGQYNPGRITAGHNLIKSQNQLKKRRVFEDDSKNKQSYMPSPAQYQLPSTLNERGAKFQRTDYNSQQLRESSNLDGNNGPSPCDYSPQRYLQKEIVKKPNQTMKGGKRNPIINSQTPAPDAYDLRKTDNTFGGYMGRKKPEKKKQIDETFIKYNPQDKVIHPQNYSYSFGKILKPIKSQSQIDAKFYDKPKQKIQGYKFSTSSRFGNGSTQCKKQNVQKGPKYINEHLTGIIPKYFFSKEKNKKSKEQPLKQKNDQILEKSQ